MYSVVTVRQCVHDTPAKIYLTLHKPWDFAGQTRLLLRTFDHSAVGLLQHAQPLAGQATCCKSKPHLGDKPVKFHGMVRTY
jgi:hypothetical protein